MKINIKLMTEEAFRTLKKNIKEICAKMLEHPSDASWLKDYLGFEPFEEKKYVIDDFILEYNDNYEEVAEKNAIMLYEALNELPKYILCNNRFWAWINFEKAYRQAMVATKKFSEQTLTNLWFRGSSRLDNMLGVISRYYYMVNVSIDLDAEDKYKLTQYIFKNTETYRSFAYRSLSMIKSITLGVLQAEYDYENKTGIELLKVPTTKIIKYASRLGSVMLLDVLTKNDMYEALYPKISTIIGNL